MKSLLLGALFSISVWAAEEEGFAPLFNGSDLKGWVNANCAPDTWSVTNGMIHCTGRPTGAIRTERQYENFILEAEWRHLSGGGNSGIFIWGTPIAAPGVPFLRGIEVQVLDHGYNASGKNQWYTTHGDVFPIHGATMQPFGRNNGQRSFPSEERSKPSPEWNHYRIVCTNGVIRLSVNGKGVSGGENCNYRKGYLALESEGAPVQFRNIRIKELPSNNPPPELCAPTDEGFRPIFTGLDLRGWESDPRVLRRWVVEGERLRLKPKNGDQAMRLWTHKLYRDAEFILDVRQAKDTDATPFLEFRGAEIRLSVTPGAWTRVHVSVKKGVISVKNDGKESSHPAPLSEGHLGLSDNGGTVEFMNLYARDLR